MFCISSRATRFFMPAGVGTGLESRASVGPLASDVGLKETLGRPRTVSWSSPLGLGQTVAWRACHNEFSVTQTTF